MTVKPIRKGYHAVTPLLSAKGVARLIDFLKAAFGAVELSRLPGANGTVMHAELKIGDSMVMLGEEMEGCPSLHGALYLYVPDADATYRAALDAGGESVEEPADRFWGDRAALVQDFAGNRWWIASHVEDVSAEEIAKRAQALFT